MIIFLKKLVLFISSYIPLYILLILKNFFERTTVEGQWLNIENKIKNAIWFDEINDWAICVLIIATVISALFLWLVIKRKPSTKRYLVLDVSDETSNYYFNYISIYLLSCMGLSLNSIVDCFVFLFLMIVVGYIYISNNMMYMNPVINLMGYKVYNCVLESSHTNEDEIQSIVVVPKNMLIKKGAYILVSGKNGFMYMSKTKKGRDNQTT